MPHHDDARKDGVDLEPPVESERCLWRSLDERAAVNEGRRPPEQPTVPLGWVDEESTRREFLKVMGASLALAGIQGCFRQPLEQIVPYVEQPELIVPGKPLYFATAMTCCGLATGLLVESHMGRPTKVDGNPLHPAVPPSKGRAGDPARSGASDIFAQAAVLELYDPDRSQIVTSGGQIRTWGEFFDRLGDQLKAQEGKQGRGLRLLTETVGSPTLAHQIELLLDRFPQAAWHQYEPLHGDNVRDGARLALAEDVNTIWHFSKADVVLSLDADFLYLEPTHLLNARDFTDRRRLAGTGAMAKHVTPIGGPAAEMSRLYVVESTPSITGAVADHRLVLKPRQIAALARAIAARLNRKIKAPEADELFGVPQKWLDAVVNDLRHYRLRGSEGAPLVVAGRFQPPEVHALVHAINHALGGVGRTVTYTAPIEARPVNQLESLRALVADMDAGRVDLLVMFDGNPLYNAPADFRFAEALRKVPFRVHLSLVRNETSALCDWHLPAAHFFEAWSDARAFDGTVSIVQPLIAPLYDNKSPHEVLSAMLGQRGRSGHDVVRDYWRQKRRGQSDTAFDDFWQQALHDGVVPETALPEKTVGLRDDLATALVTGPYGSAAETAASRDTTVELVFRPDPTILDGRMANIGWLQELPKPLSRLTWDNAALISPATAQRLGLVNGDDVEVRRGERAISLPVWIMPGQADDCLTMSLGYGRTAAGRVGDGAGFDVYPLRTSDAMWWAGGATVRKTGGRHRLACVQHHHRMEGRDLVRSGTLAEYREKPQHPAFMGLSSDQHSLSLFADHKYDDYKWGMSINLGTCIGCQACVIACQAENNIPVVGRQQVSLGREMHWIRADTYYEGEAANPTTYFQPVPCMQCENAPCELVCPVGATSHSSEGLNDMVYNRCVGTRYCSNNCPYKVRRFNFLQYSSLDVPVLKLLANPDVTVRNRGVMEKCTYCVQRINAARIESEKEGRRIRDGDVVTACQAACPTAAIVFGDLNDPQSEARAAREHPLAYALLAELNTRPRTTYLAAVRNPNPALKAERRDGSAD